MCTCMHVCVFQNQFPIMVFIIFLGLPPVSPHCSSSCFLLIFLLFFQFSLLFTFLLFSMLLPLSLFILLIYPSFLSSTSFPLPSLHLLFLLTHFLHARPSKSFILIPLPFVHAGIA